jgi:hypothetical protein
LVESIDLTDERSVLSINSNLGIRKDKNGRT